MNITTVPSLLGVFALALLLLLMIKLAVQPADDKVAKHLLLVMLLGLFSVAFCLLSVYAEVGQHWPRLGSIEIGFAYWIGPSFYFYLKRMSGGPDPFTRRSTQLHWLPAILVAILLLLCYLRLVPGNATFLGYPVVYSRELLWLVWWGFHVQLAVYLLLCWPLFRKYRKQLEDNFSAISRLHLLWLQLCFYGFVAVIVAERVLPALHLTASTFSQPAGITLYVFIILLMYFALDQNRLRFSDARQPVTPVVKYHRSGLRDDSAQYYLDKLNRMMIQERYYLQSELTLKTLAERLKVSPNHLSQILNVKLGKNFHEYINEQRMLHARQLLLQEPTKSVTDIAFETGYNNKNSFYNAFKRHCGMTPSDYRQLHQKSPCPPPPNSP